MMHFQDPHNWDIDRIHKCDIHYATPDGRILPFCTFNVIPELYRDRVQRKFSIPFQEWEKRAGKQLQKDKYHRLLSKEEQARIKAEFDKYRKYKEKVEYESDWGEDAYEGEMVTTEEPQHSFVPLDMIGAAQAVLNLPIITPNVPAGAGKSGVAHSVVMQPQTHKHDHKKSTMEHPAAGGCGSGTCGC
jgi:hypothetical protein